MRALAPLLIAAIAASSLCPTTASAGQTPQINRPIAAPQAIGALHTLRVIPEACTRIQGRFTGDPANPYEFAMVRTAAHCQARARVVDAATASPQDRPGWLYVDQVRVPSAACGSLQAEVRIWRHDARGAVPPRLDAQGRSRLYLKDSLDARRQGAADLPVYAVETKVGGKGCE